MAVIDGGSRRPPRIELAVGLQAAELHLRSTRVTTDAAREAEGVQDARVFFVAWEARTALHAEHLPLLRHRHALPHAGPIALHEDAARRLVLFHVRICSVCSDPTEVNFHLPSKINRWMDGWMDGWMDQEQRRDVPSREGKESQNVALTCSRCRPAFRIQGTRGRTSCRRKWRSKCRIEESDRQGCPSRHPGKLFR